MFITCTNNECPHAHDDGIEMEEVFCDEVSLVYNPHWCPLCGTPILAADVQDIVDKEAEASWEDDYNDGDDYDPGADYWI